MHCQSLSSASCGLSDPQGRRRWIGVREDHMGEGEPVNTIVAIDLDEPGTSPGRVLACRGEDCVCHRGGDRRGGRLARATPDLAAAWDEMDIDLRRLGQTHHAVGIEISLHRNGRPSL
jgi:hypothetical protein